MYRFSERPCQRDRLRIIVACLVLFFVFLPSGFRSQTAVTPICVIQGSGFHSPREGQTLRTQGVVHGDLDDKSRRGFFLQAQNCDGDQNTSDGIFVYLGERLNVVSLGDHVEVVGKVKEYFGLTELETNPADVNVLSSGNALPIPVELNPPFDDHQSSEYYERLEGMRVSMDESWTVGPTDYDDRTWVVHAGLGIERVFHDDPRGVGEIVCVDDDGEYEIAPEVKVGDRVLGLLGVQDYRAGEFCLQLFSQPSVDTQSQVVQSLKAGAAASDAGLSGYPEFRIATFNLANLFDTFDDPNTEDTVLSASEYQRRLGKRASAIHDALAEPPIVALQEVENFAVIQALVNRPEIEAQYGIVWQDGPDRRGMDVALIYQVHRAQVLDYQIRQGCTQMVDGLGPDGNRDTTNPINDITCDTDNDGVLDGNRLFSRPPLMVKLRVCDPECPQGESSVQDEEYDEMDVWIINAHWKSKLEDTETTQYTLPRRMQQSHFVAMLVEEILESDPQAFLVVLGDLNDHSDSGPLSALEENVTNLITLTPKSDRYTYIYHGRSQALDHILVSMRRSLVPVDFSLVHINSDFPTVFETVDGSYYRSSDHDLLLVSFTTLDHFCNLPIVLR